MALLLESRTGPALVLTIDNEAQHNVLSRELVAELKTQAEFVAKDSTLRAVIITGKGTRAFCAGANLKERKDWTESDVRKWLVELNDGLRAIEKCEKPWIAAVNGLALGGGCELALACDLRVLDPAAEIGLTETKIGIIPGGGGCVRLARVIGMGRARDLILTARRVPAQEAYLMGLASRVSDPGRSLEMALQVAEQIAGNAPVAIAAAKNAIEDAWDLELAEGLEKEREWYEKPLKSEDRLEGLKAFAERRAPVWQGK